MPTPIAGSNLNAIPGPTQQTLASNFLDFSTGWAQQYLPDLYEAEVERYGNRMLSGFLAKVGAEEAMTSDQVVWSEQGRLHVSATTAATTNIVDDNLLFATVADAKLFRLNDTVLLYCTIDGTTPANVGTTIKCLVTGVDDYGTKKIKVIPYTQLTLDDGVTAGATTYTTASVFQVMVYGTEFAKGSSVTRDSLTPSFTSFTNKPIILRDKYHINGSDVSQIGWVEVTGEEGQNGYMWYLKAEGDTRARFNDYLEMSMLEAEAAVGTQLDNVLGSTACGTEGLFEAITKRGHVTTETFVSEYGVNAGALLDMGTVDAILLKLDKEGAIEENMLYLDRAEALAIDNMLGTVGNGHAAGVSFGLFDNSSDMALNLGFTGFRRGSYDFYKTDWKYLNDKQAYGAMIPSAAGSALHTKISGVLCPAGTSSVYDENMGKNMKRPFLHVRYRASQTDNRRLKTWVTGSVGAATSDLDAMEVNYLSERCLVAQAANNFMLFKR
tara:strand:+ start:4653 stop:6140 length:1488 start_codon:yes stop_codon:yes gene_type:complete